MTAFLIDEMFPAAAAEILRTKYGHDAVQVGEVGLQAADDTQVAAAAPAESRAAVTENVADFAAERDLVLVFVLKTNLPAGGGQAAALARILDRWDRDQPDPYLGHHWPTMDWQSFTVRGRTKTEVEDNLRAKHTELATGVRTPANYTVEQCLKDWLQTLNTQAESTLTGYWIMARHLTGLIGNVKLVELKVRDVDFALGKLAERLSTRSVRLARMILIQAIRNAMVNDLVVRNVADLTAVPTGKPGRPSKSLNLDQALGYQHLDRSNN